MELAALGERLLKATMNPQGLNLGMNVGRCAARACPATSTCTSSHAGTAM